ncbi:hypothetical protein AHAS_Ahas17G0192000 [Arachis hypogaea]
MKSRVPGTSAPNPAAPPSNSDCSLAIGTVTVTHSVMSCLLLLIGWRRVLSPPLRIKANAGVVGHFQQLLWWKGSNKIVKGELISLSARVGGLVLVMLLNFFFSKLGLRSKLCYYNL